jgi:hypothetical protein
MDIAVFVGFAASGPLHIPVAVDNLAQFTGIFGDDAPLAWNPEQNEPIYAYLAPAVRAFFRNGGRRCWIVRVADEEKAQSNFFSIPGLAEFAGGNITPAFAPARSEGSWSDSLRVSASLLIRPVAISGGSLAGLKFELAPNLANALTPGDLLRLNFRAEGYVLLLAVKSIQAEINDSTPSVKVIGGQSLWLAASWKKMPPSDLGQAQVFTHKGVATSINAFVPKRLQSASSPPSLELDWPAAANENIVKLDLPMPLAQAPAPGSLLRVDFGAEQFWLMVQDLTTVHDFASPLGEAVRVTGEGFWQMQNPPATALSLPSTGERLTFELWVRQGEANPVRFSELAFNTVHPRFWGALPADEQLYAEEETVLKAKLTEQWREAEATFRTARANLWQEAAAPRFPLAGINDSEAFYFPIAMPFLPEHFLGPVEVPETALERDGLAQFDWRFFLDDDLIETRVQNLLGQADFLRYQSPSPRALKGIHAALRLEEATLIVVPDAVHRAWQYEVPDEPPAPLPSAPLRRPEWWRFLDCSSPPDIKPVSEPQWENFLECGIRIIPAPVLVQSEGPDATGTFVLTWQATLSEARYILEESTQPDFSDAAAIYTGADDRRTIYGRTPGDYYYRVRAESAGASSDWSNGIVVRVGLGQRWQIEPVENYSDHALLAVHRALLRLCAARGDLFAVLSLPEHYREDEAITHLAALKSPLAPITTMVLALSFGETRALSCGAVYHPWLIGREENRPTELRSTPPDGAAAGILARRTLGRGVWVAPANELLRGVVALMPPIARERWLDLQTAQLNLIRQEPRGFLAFSADTLSDDADLRPINVRRLIMLLRRLALRHGATYVFEPNDAAFRRLVQRGFEALLNFMFERGAFAGRTPETSFQVITGASLNTPQSVEQGRFIVELRVAPSLPMTFLTIRLVQSGDRTLVTEER